jgi:cytochrome c-type biogenesis protein CcmF
VLNSVHAFANDPERGIFILAILLIAIGVPLALFAWRAPSLASGAPFEPVSRETGILANNLLLTTAAATTMVGTLYPLILDAATGAKISVGPPYFVATVVPLFGVLALLMPFGPLLQWRRGDAAAALRSLRWAGIAALVAGAVSLFLYAPRSAYGSLAAVFGVWLIGGAIADLHRRAGGLRYWRTLTFTAWAVALAHGGLGIVALGSAGAGVWKAEALAVLRPGQAMMIGDYSLRFDAARQVRGPNYQADEATITVLADGRELGTMRPQKRNYPAEGMVTSHSSIRTTGFSDLHVVMGDPREGGAWVFRAYVNPLAPLIWFGAVVMALGGFCGIAARVRRMRSQRVTVPAAASGVVP